jgi:hypothetical protein
LKRKYRETSGQSNAPIVKSNEIKDEIENGG